MPLRVERSELRWDSGGDGRTRGGLGLRREIRLLDGEARYSVLSDRAVLPPFGVRGAGPAASVWVSIRRDAEETELATPGKVTGHAISAGDTVIMESAGGGGYGDPLTREPERVRQDVLAGYVSTARARLGYGVVLAPDGEVDARATLAERARLAAARRRDERDPYGGRRGKHRALRPAPRLAHALRLETGDLVEMLGRHARRSARGCAEDVAAGLRTTPGKISAVRNPPVLQAPASVDAQWRPTGRSGIFPEPTRRNP